MRRALVIAACGAGLLAPGNASAAGGPVPPVQGGAGATMPGSPVNYVAIVTGRDTLVQRVRRDGGTVERYRRMHGTYGVPGAAYDGSTTGLSADGRTLVLAEATALYPPRETRLAVLDPETLRVRRHVTLPGFFAVDAISPDGRDIYLLRYPKPRSDLLSYDVVAYDLKARRLSEPIVDPREPDEMMGGIPISRALSPDGRWTYTLYSGEENFVHALDTREGTARCIDLPGGDTSSAKLTLDGDTLRVGGFATIDLRTFEAEAPAASAPRPRVTPAPREDGGGVPWVPAAIGVAVLGAVALAAGRRRRSAEEVLDLHASVDHAEEKATL